MANVTKKAPVFDPESVRTFLASIKAIKLEQVEFNEAGVESSAVRGMPGLGLANPGKYIGTYDPRSTLPLDEDDIDFDIKGGQMYFSPEDDDPLDQDHLMIALSLFGKGICEGTKRPFIIIPTNMSYEKKRRSTPTDPKTCSSTDCIHAVGGNPFNPQSNLCSNCPMKGNPDRDLKCKSIIKVHFLLITQDEKGKPRYVLGYMPLQGMKYQFGMKPFNACVSASLRKYKNDITFGFALLVGNKKESRKKDNETMTWYEYIAMARFTTPKTLHPVLIECRDMVEAYYTKRDEVERAKAQETTTATDTSFEYGQNKNASADDVPTYDED